MTDDIPGPAAKLYNAIKEIENVKRVYIRLISDRLDVRKCFACSMTIDFAGFWNANAGKNVEWLIRIWREPRVELHCCRCLAFKTGTRYYTGVRVFDAATHYPRPFTFADVLGRGHGGESRTAREEDRP